MLKVSEKHHLKRRGSVWYYRRRVPQGAQAAFGPTIQYSLETSDLARAVKLRELEDVKWSAKFENVGGQTATSSIPARRLSEDDAQQIVRSYVANMDRAFKDRFAMNGPVDRHELEEQRVVVGQDLSALGAKVCAGGPWDPVDEPDR